MCSYRTRLVSIENLANELNWESLEKRRYYHRMILFYKIQNGLTPEYLSSIIPPMTNDRYNLRNASDIPGIFARTTLYYNSFFPSVIREWNNLPLNVRNISTLSSFERYFKENNQSPNTQILLCW